MAESGIPEARSKALRSPSPAQGFLSFAASVIESASIRSARTTVRGACIGAVPGALIGLIAAIAGAILRGPITDYIVLGAFSLLVLGLGGALLGAVGGAILGWAYGVVAGASSVLWAVDFKPAGPVPISQPLMQPEILTSQVKLRDRAAGEEQLAGADLA